jgi:hypothetical protein
MRSIGRVGLCCEIYFANRLASLHRLTPPPDRFAVTLPFVQSGEIEDSRSETSRTPKP